MVLFVDLEEDSEDPHINLDYPAGSTFPGYHPFIQRGWIVAAADHRLEKHGPERRIANPNVVSAALGCYP